MDFGKSGLEALKLGPRYLAAIAIACGLILFLPESAAKTLHLDQLAKNYGHWLGVAFIASGVLFCVDLAIKIAGWQKQASGAKEHSKRVYEYLCSLSEDEKQILRFYVAQESKTNVLATGDCDVQNLEAAKIIYRSSSTGRSPFMFGYNLTETARKHIDVEPGLLHGTTDYYRTDLGNRY